MRSLNFLVVEDNDADIHHLQRIFESLGLKYKLSILSDGESAVNFLSKRTPYENLRDPDLTFLDLHLPKLSGIEILESLSPLSRPPLCVVTGLDTERDNLMKKFGVRRIAYMVKPVTREMLLNCFRSFEHLAPVAEEVSATEAASVRRTHSRRPTSSPSGPRSHGKPGTLLSGIKG